MGGRAWQGKVCMVGGCALQGGMHGRGGHAWWGCVWQGACMTGGAYMAGGMRGRGGMHGRGACMAWGMHGRGHGGMKSPLPATHVPPVDRQTPVKT